MNLLFESIWEMNKTIALLKLEEQNNLNIEVPIYDENWGLYNEWPEFTKEN